MDAKGDVWASGLNNWGEAGDAASAGGDDAVLPCLMKVPDLCGKDVNVLGGGNHYSAAVTAGEECFPEVLLMGTIWVSNSRRSSSRMKRSCGTTSTGICAYASGPRWFPFGASFMLAAGAPTGSSSTRSGRHLRRGLDHREQMGTGEEEDEDAAREIRGRGLGRGELVWRELGASFPSPLLWPDLEGR